MEKPLLLLPNDLLNSSFQYKFVPVCICVLKICILSQHPIKNERTFGPRKTMATHSSSVRFLHAPKRMKQRSQCNDYFVIGLQIFCNFAFFLDRKISYDRKPFCFVVDRIVKFRLYATRSALPMLTLRRRAVVSLRITEYQQIQ